jgi:hypothetical protein
MMIGKWDTSLVWKGAIEKETNRGGERMSEIEIKSYNGFILINGKTWQPKPLYVARRQKQRQAARRARTGIVWTGNKPSVQIG